MGTGRHLKKSLLDYALGLPVDMDDFAYRKRGRYTAMYAPHVILSKVTPQLIDKVKQQAGVYAVVQTRTDDRVVESNADRGLFVLTCADSKDMAWKAATNAGWLLEDLLDN
jgi:hypothetical protein